MATKLTAGIKATANINLTANVKLTAGIKLTIAAAFVALCAVCSLAMSASAYALSGSDPVRESYSVAVLQTDAAIIKTDASVAEVDETAFAIYSNDDNSLTFYADETVPNKGDKYNGKTVTDVFTGFDSKRYSSNSGQPWKSYREDIYSVVADESFSVIQPIGMAYWFYGLVNCSSFDLKHIDTGQVNNMSYLFVNCESVKTLDLSGWDTSAVQTMYSMFHQCYSLSSVNLSGFDTPKVTTFGYMFYQCRALSSIDVSMFNTSKATYMASMFYECSSLSNLDLSNFNTSNVTSMRGMFQNCTSLKHLNLSSCDTGKVSTYSYFLSGDKNLLDFTVSDNFTLFNKSTSALTDIQTWYDAFGNVVSDNYMIGQNLSAGTYYTYGIDFDDMNAEIVGKENDESTWGNTSSVNVGDAIELEMSTTLPSLHADSVAAGGYSVTFHNKLETALDIDSLESDFKLEIAGNVIDPSYYRVDISNTAKTFDVGITPLDITTLDDGCTFHVDIDLSALYNDGVIGDADFGTSDVRVFFYISLEDVEDVNASYLSTSWYEVVTADTVLHTSDSVTVEVYTFEIDVTKTDIETGEPLAGATFGLYSDLDCNNPVQKSGADYVITTDAAGYGCFRGIAEGTYFVKELSAPHRYTLIDDPLEVTVVLDGDGMDDHVYPLSVQDVKAIVDISDPNSGITVEVVDDGDGGFTYNGQKHTPHVAVTDETGNELVESVDYTLDYADNVNAGTGYITVCGCGGYTGDITVSFTIAPAAVTIVVNDASKVYGQADPDFSGTVTGVVAGEDLNVSYIRINQDEAAGIYEGVLSATYDDNSNYTVTISAGTFTIAKADLSDKTQGFVLTLPDGYAYDYTGFQITPSVEVYDSDGNLLEEGVDFAVSYGDNTEIGTGTVTVEGIGNYEGSIETTFDIVAVVSPVINITKDMFSVDADDVTYTGNAIEKTVTSELVLGIDYVVSYKNNIDAGKATIVISGIGEYTGTVEYQFNIVKAFSRLAGDDRYSTMSEVGSEAFDRCDAVVLTTGGNYPDSLASAGLAGIYSCPILLTDSGVLSDQAAFEIERLGASTVYIVGGSASVSADIENTLIDRGLTVERIAGTDRYATACATYSAAVGSWGIGGHGSKTAIIAAGTTFADSLCASSYAWWATSPIFLAGKDGIDSETASAIASGGFERIVIVGGSASVPESVEAWAADVAPTTRIAGADRYETSIEFASWANLEGMLFNNSAIATGRNYPDALSGGALCGRYGSVLLLADDSNTAAVDLLGTHRDEISRVYFLGGVNSISEEVVDLFTSALT